MSIARLRTEGKIEVTAMTTSDPYIIEGDIGTIITQIIFDGGSGTAKLQGTIAKDSELEAGTTTADDWVDWDLGDVTSNTKQITAVAPNAIRIVNSGASAVICRYRGNYGK